MHTLTEPISQPKYQSTKESCPTALALTCQCFPSTSGCSLPVAQCDMPKETAPDPQVLTTSVLVGCSQQQRVDGSIRSPWPSRSRDLGPATQCTCGSWSLIDYPKSCFGWMSMCLFALEGAGTTVRVLDAPVAPVAPVSNQMPGSLTCTPSSPLSLSLQERSARY